MSIVSVLLLAGMFFLWRSYSDTATKLESANSSLTNAQGQYTDANNKVELMRAMLGYSTYSESEMEQRTSSFEGDPEMARLISDYDTAMKQFPSDAAEKNLLKLPESLIETIRKRNMDLEALLKEKANLEAQLKATVQRETAARLNAETAQKKAETELEEARQEHSQQLAAVNKQRQDTIAKFTEYKRSLDAKLAQVSQDLAAATKERDELNVTVADLRDKLNDWEKPDFSSPQGRIVTVANGSSRVWIDLGSADGLRPGVTFSVLDENSVNISEARPKAQIVVTRVVDDHLSEARAIDINYRNIIVSEDLVYSPAWRSGRKVGFALVGEMDIDGDGRDDIDQVREIIRMAGGRVDAESTPKGGEKGSVDYNTTWLVMGTDLSVPENASDEQRAQQQQRLQSYTSFRKDAERFGVREISLDKLMGYIKSTSANRTVPLGNRIRGDDFSARGNRQPPSSNGSVSDKFTKRQPPR
jgi:hypothetical protein